MLSVRVCVNSASGPPIPCNVAPCFANTATVSTMRAESLPLQLGAGVSSEGTSSTGKCGLHWGVMAWA